MENFSGFQVSFLSEEQTLRLRLNSAKIFKLSIWVGVREKGVKNPTLLTGGWMKVPFTKCERSREKCFLEGG